jgi:hypothetical protein
VVRRVDEVALDSKMPVSQGQDHAMSLYAEQVRERTGVYR